MPPNSRPPRGGMAVRVGGVSDWRAAWFSLPILPLATFARLSKIEANSGLIRAVEGGKG
jgi:hypothetical protein